jgi:hypothetical protein
MLGTHGVDDWIKMITEEAMWREWRGVEKWKKSKIPCATSCM